MVPLSEYSDFLSSSGRGWWPSGSARLLRFLFLLKRSLCLLMLPSAVQGGNCWISVHNIVVSLDSLYLKSVSRLFPLLFGTIWIKSTRFLQALHTVTQLYYPNIFWVQTSIPRRIFFFFFCPFCFLKGVHAVIIFGFVFIIFQQSSLNTRKTWLIIETNKNRKYYSDYFSHREGVCFVGEQTKGRF